ncbi:MAG: MFS transporter, partial [Candidatus Binatia bacterium]
YSLYMSYLVAALEEDAGFTPAHASAVYALVGGAIVFGGVLFGRLSDRVGRRATMVSGYLVKAACAALVLAGAEPWAAISAVFFGLVMSGLGAVTAAHVADHLDSRSFGTAFGVVTLVFGIAQVVGPQLGGWLADVTGSFTVGFVVSALAALFGALSSATLPRAPVRA